MSPTASNVVRAASLFLSFAFGIVGLALNADAFVKSNNQKRAVLQVAPRGTSIDIDDSDVFNSGAAVTAFCGVLALVSSVSLGLLLPSLFRSEKRRERSLATRTLPWQGVVLSLSTVGLFAALVAMTDFVANREAKRALGVTTVYHDIGYLRLAIILPWIAFLFGATSSVLSFTSARAVSDDHKSDSTSTEGIDTEKHGNVRTEERQA
uniref:Mannose-6-phosphate isomerase (Phosphomannose isomerase) (PMI)) n=1 Tax=Ganoderma boninense TaxID=34458 RepID=A0A5K1JXI4_9APHY|nr:Mannose-6-phosphate isomerase (EC (Phosphohexomutase) (Phosphomannose isomerase) (PMI) [Ganoderma boninense]